MFCKSCQSQRQTALDSEINIHIPGPQNLSTKSVWAFPQLLVCLDCGFTELNIERAELSQLADSLDQPENAA